MLQQLLLEEEEQVKQDEWEVIRQVDREHERIMRSSVRHIFRRAQRGLLYERSATSVVRLRRLERELRIAIMRELGEEHGGAWDLYNSNIWSRGHNVREVEDSSVLMTLNCPPPPGNEKDDVPSTRWTPDYLQSILRVLYSRNIFPEDTIPMSMNYRPLCPCLVAQASGARILGGTKPLTCTHFAEPRTKPCDRSMYGAFSNITAACCRSAWLRINHVSSNTLSTDILLPIFIAHESAILYSSFQ